MMKLLGNIPNWALGLIITLLFCFAFISRGSIGFIEEMELKTYDLRMKLFTPPLTSERIAIVAIDSESIAKLGRWPWPRNRISIVIDKLKNSGAKVIGLNILFTEPEESTGLAALKSIKKSFAEANLHSSTSGRAFYANLEKMELGLDNDAKLLGSLERSGNVVLPLVMNTAPDISGSLADKKVPSFVKRSATNMMTPAEDEFYYYPQEASDMLYPIMQLGEASIGVGHLNKFPGRFSDGIDRWEALLIKYGTQFYPSFALTVAAKYMGIKGPLTADIRDEG